MFVLPVVSPVANSFAYAVSSVSRSSCCVVVRYSLSVCLTISSGSTASGGAFAMVGG